MCVRVCVHTLVLTLAWRLPGTGGCIGAEAAGSGLFNNYLIPFSTNITVTIEMAGPKAGHLVIFWMVLRGRTKASCLLGVVLI